MTTIPAAAMHLVQGRYYAHVATLNANGSLQISQVWIDGDQDHLTFNCYESSAKARNLRANPNIAISIAGQGNTSHESLAIRGRVVEMIHEGTEEHIDRQANYYLGLDGYPFHPPNEVRVIMKIAPEKVYHRQGHDLEMLHAHTLRPYEDQIRHLLNKNMDGWLDTFADDAVFELPFAPADYPQKLEGKAAIAEYVKDFTKNIDLTGFPELTVHQTLDPAVIVVEALAEGLVVATGKPYRMRYVWVITVQKGKIVRQKDYWNALAVQDALGGGDGMRSTFNIDTAK